MGRCAVAVHGQSIYTREQPPARSETVEPRSSGVALCKSVPSNIVSLIKVRFH